MRVAGDEVPQVYVGTTAVATRADGRTSLGGFERLHLAAGETKHVTIQLAERAFQYWDVGSHDWATAWGNRAISVGSSSRDLRLTATDAPLKPAAEEVLDLLAMVQGVGPGTSLNDKVTAIQGYIAANQTAKACAAIVAFKNEVKAQTGKKIPAATAAALQHEADRLAASVGC